MVELSEKQIIDQIAARLSGVYERVDTTEVSRVVHREYQRFEGRPIRDFIPLFVERHARAELTKLSG